MRFHRSSLHWGVISELLTALRAALPGAQIRLLDATPVIGGRSVADRPRALPPPAQVTLRLLISAAGETDYEAALRELMASPVVSLDEHSVRLTITPATLEEKARLWLALALPYEPCILVEAGPVAI